MEKAYYLEKLEDELGIYIPGGDGYFRYALRHIVKPFTDGGTHQNQDLWRLHKLRLCRREGDAFQDIYDFPLTTAGEWECAFKIEGTPDFHGGFHGYEHMTSLDVQPEEESLFIRQESRIVLQGTRDEPVALHSKEYLFRDGMLTLKQNLKWERSVQINRAFLTMLPICRNAGDFLVTDTALYKGQEYDVSKEGHKTPLSSGCTESINEMTILGKQSGIRATVTASYGKRFFIQNTSAYNKFYFYYAKNEAVEKGEEWNTLSTFRFTYEVPKV